MIMVVPLEEVELKRLVGTVRVLARVALCAGFGFAVLHHVIALTVGAEHGDAYHLDLLHEKAPVWHT